MIDYLKDYTYCNIFFLMILKMTLMIDDDNLDF